MNYQQETFIWTPLIGFDKEQHDRGVEEYYSTIGFNPGGISLFVFCPDIVHFHEPGMEQERVLPPDNCNYYGTIRNDVREIQAWTNFELRELVAGLEARGAETYMGLMGVFDEGDPAAVDHYNTGHEEWLTSHKEVMGVWTNCRYSLNVLKRFKDGTYYEDFFVEKIRAALRDYGFSGVHAADNFCPFGSGGTASNGDYSDDMLGQFIDRTGLKLPVEVTKPVADTDRAGLKKRGDFIWNRYRLEWLQFMSWRWAAFWEKVCTALHADGKKVMVNNAWCSEPFEAVYRFGIDYKQLHEAGVDYIVAESVPTGADAVSRNETPPNHFYQYMTMPALMKAAVPGSKVICLNGVNDASEEWSTINHYAAASERDIFTLTNLFLQGSHKTERAMDGMMICLGDGLTRDEWSWLREKYSGAYSEIPSKVLTPTLIWSDAAHAKFLPDYIETRRWSLHKTLFEIAKLGGQIANFARIEDLSALSGPLFIPNADLLPDSERAALAAYSGGSIICTSLLERNFQLPGVVPDFYFTDPQADYKMHLTGYNLGYIDYPAISAMPAEVDTSADINGSPRYAADPNTWRQEMVFRKVSQAFMQVCARLLRSQVSGGLTTDIKDALIPFQLPDGRIRLFLGNDNRLQYRTPTVHSERRIKSVVSHSKFPALPSKMLDIDGRMIVPKSDGSHKSVEYYGFVTKIPPGGLTVLDVEFAD